MELLKFLIADDSEVMRQKIASDLKVSSNQQLQIDFCNGGKEALECLTHTEKAYNVILLDLHMPDVDGLEVLRQMKSNDIHIPVYMISVDESRARIVESIQAGAEKYLAKPYRRESLAENVDELLNQQGLSLMEKRVAPRQPFELPLKFIKVHSQGRNVVEIEGKDCASANISETGIGMTSHYRFEKGDKLSFESHDHRVQFKAEIDVVYCLRRTKDFYIGCQFAQKLTALPAV